jgi:flagellar hook-length control protein FliK
MNDSPGPVQAAFGASDAGAADAEGLPLEGLRADLSTLGVEVVHTSQNPPAGAGAGSGAVDPSLGGPSDATSNAPRLPAVAATGGALTSLPLGDFARSLAMSSYAASGPVETPEAAPRWTLGPFEAESPHQQVVRAVRLQWANGVSEARLRLHPEHLGDVTIDLRVEQGRVSASLRLDNPAAAEWIRAQRAELQASLSAQGLDLGTLEIVVDPDGRRRQPATPDPQPRSRVRRQGSETPRFEVLA